MTSQASATTSGTTVSASTTTQGLDLLDLLVGKYIARRKVCINLSQLEIGSKRAYLTYLCLNLRLVGLIRIHELFKFKLLALDLLLYLKHLFLMGVAKLLELILLVFGKIEFLRRLRGEKQSKAQTPEVPRTSMLALRRPEKTGQD